MGEKNNFSKYIFQNTIVSVILVSLFGVGFHYIPVYSFSWTVVGLFVLVGAIFGFLTGMERVRYLKLQSEKEAMQASFGQIEFTLKRSAHQYRVLLDNLTDAVYQVNEQGRFVYFNQAMSLLTGYAGRELKNMQIGQIQLKNENAPMQDTSMLDNNAYRHREQWKCKDSRIRTVEISTRMLQSVNRVYELNVARDSKPSEERPDNNKIKELQSWLYGKIREEAHFRNRFYNQVLVTLNGFSNLLTQKLKDFSTQDEQVNKVLTDWKRTRNLLQLFISKNNRDKQARQSFWDLNEVLLQELSYLKTSMDTDKISIQIQFGSNLVKAKAAGNDLTLALGILLRSVCASIIDAGGGQLRVSTNMTADSLFVQLNTSKSRNFNVHFSNSLQLAEGTPLYPLPKSGNLPQLLFSQMNMHFDSDREGDGLQIKVRLPFERKVLEQQVKPPTRDNNAEPPKQRDFVIL
ncbi:PAS domain S-box protein [bacterium]|nr:PAS domain S-box protein [bacterium]